jgi:hypothetical protein
VSRYGDPASSANFHIRRLGLETSDARSTEGPLEVCFLVLLVCTSADVDRALFIVCSIGPELDAVRYCGSADV